MRFIDVINYHEKLKELQAALGFTAKDVLCSGCNRGRSAIGAVTDGRDVLCSGCYLDYARAMLEAKLGN